MTLYDFVTGFFMVVGAVGSIATTISSLTILPENVRKIAAAIGLDFAKIKAIARPTNKIPPPPKPPIIMIVLVSLVLSGCAGSFELMRARGVAARSVAATPSIDCKAIDSNRILWQGLAEGGAAITGAGGLSIIPVEDKDARIGVAIASVAAAGFTAIAAKLANDFGEEWVTKCSQ